MANDSSWGAIAGNAVQTLGNYAVAVATNKRGFRNQMKAMAQQQSYNKELWDYQNAYNTPQAQMERLQAAGLNPRLIYGSGAAGGGQAGPIAPTEVPAERPGTVEVPNFTNTYLMSRQADAQYKATMQNVESARVTAQLTQTRTALENLKLLREGVRSKNYKDLAQAEVDTQKWIAMRSGELYANEKSKGGLMDQLHDFRSESNKKILASQDLENAFRNNRNKLADMGIYSSDNVALRMLVQAANRMGIDLGELLLKGKDQLMYLLK